MKTRYIIITMLLLSFTFGFTAPKTIQPKIPLYESKPYQHQSQIDPQIEQQKNQEEIIRNQRKIIRQQREMQDDLEQQKRWDWINQRNR